MSGRVTYHITAEDRWL